MKSFANYFFEKYSVDGHWGEIERTRIVSLMMYHYNFMADNQL